MAGVFGLLGLAASAMLFMLALRSWSVLLVAAIAGLMAIFAKPLGTAFRSWSVVTLVIPITITYTSLAAATNPDRSEHQLMLIVLAGGAFWLGAAMVRPVAQPAPGNSASPTCAPPELNLDWTRLTALWACGTGLACAVLVSDGVPALSEQVDVARQAILKNGYVGTVIVTALQATAITAAGSMIRRQRFQRREIGLLVASLGTLLLFGNRGLYFVPVLTILVFFLMHHPKRIGRAALLGLAMLIFTSAVGYQRNFQMWGPGYDMDLERAGIPRAFRFLGPIVSYFKGSSTTLDAIIATYPASAPYGLGSTFFSPLFSPLPGEQPTAGQVLKDVLGYQFSGFGLAPGAIGGFYMDFGLLGVVVGFYLLGLGGRIVQTKSVRDARWELPYAFFVAHLWFMNYAHPFPYLAVITVPIVLWLVTRQGLRH